MGYIHEKGGMQEGVNGPFSALVEVDLKKAVTVYKRAITMGDNLACNYLGSFYYNYTNEPEKAVQLFR